MQQKTKFIPFYPHVRASLPPSSLAEAGSSLLPRRVHILWSDALRSSSCRRTIITSFALLFTLDFLITNFFFFFGREVRSTWSVYIPSTHPSTRTLRAAIRRHDTQAIVYWVLRTAYSHHFTTVFLNATSAFHTRMSLRLSKGINTQKNLQCSTCCQHSWRILIRGLVCTQPHGSASLYPSHHRPPLLLHSSTPLKSTTQSTHSIPHTDLLCR